MSRCLGFILLCWCLPLGAVDIPHDSQDWAPDVSPDGQWVAYAGDPDGSGHEILMLSLVNGETRRLTDNERYDERPRFSPDGARLVYNGQVDGQHELFLIDLDSGRETRLTEHPAQDQRPDFTADGQALVFDSNRDGGQFDLYRMALGGTEPPVRLTRDPARDAYPAVSPDGRRIAFTSDRSGNPDLWLLDLSDHGLRALTTDPGMDQAPRWSPDGQHLLFFSNRSGNAEIYRLDLDDGTLHQLTVHPDWDFMPDVHPDGRTLVFDSRRDGRRGIYRMGWDGASPTKLSNLGSSPLLDLETASLATLPASESTARALPAELANAALDALSTDADRAYQFARHWLLSEPRRSAARDHLAGHLTRLLPLLEERADTSGEAALVWALALAKLDRDAAAEAAFGKVLGLDRGSLLAQDWLGGLETKAALIEVDLTAIETLERTLIAARDRHPARVGRQVEQVINARGYALLGEQHISMARALFELNTRLFPESANTWDSLGEATLADGEPRRSLVYYRRALALDPGSDNARNSVARLVRQIHGGAGSR